MQNISVEESTNKYEFDIFIIQNNNIAMFKCFLSEKVLREKYLQLLWNVKMFQ